MKLSSWYLIISSITFAQALFFGFPLSAVSAGKAAIHRGPESALRSERDGESSRRPESHADSEKRLQKLVAAGTGAQGKVSAKIWNWNNPTYTTSLTVGTPPQSLAVLLSISDGDLSLPSARCWHDCDGKNRYDSNQSSTAKVPPTPLKPIDRFDSIYYGIAAQNLRVQDTLTVSGVEVANLSFGASDLMQAPWPVPYDGMLGLAPEKAQRVNGTRNLFLEMVARGLLDRNVFSLKLPRDSGDEGSLVFGEIDEDAYEGELVPIPVIESPASDIWNAKGGRWAVGADGLATGNGSVDLRGYTAVFETGYPFITLPYEVTTMLDRYLGMEEGTGLQRMSIDCARREELVDLTITLGGMDFILTPWEYTIEVDTSVLHRNKGVRYMSAFAVGGVAGINHEFIVLGSSFLPGLYSVFDELRRRLA